MYFSEHENLDWLCTILFTDEFWERPTALSSYTGYDYETFYPAVADFIQNHDEAKKLYENALHAIEKGDISKRIVQFDEWGEPDFHGTDLKVDTHDFLIWAEKKGHIIPKVFYESIETIVHMRISKQQAEEQRAYQYPKITYEQFQQKCKEPLWNLTTGILYLLGRRSRSSKAETEMKFIERDDVGKKLTDYIKDSKQSDSLTLIENTDYTENTDFLCVHKVKPDDLIKWAKSLPITVPMLATKKTYDEPPKYMTKEMHLMMDAVEEHWKDYDLENPNSHIAPYKQKVVDWLMEEAKKRDISDFSLTKAKNIDTLIRCPHTRKGGNTR